MDTCGCRNDLAQQGIGEIVETVTRYFNPTYDIHGSLMYLADYQSKLRGAVIEINLAIRSHQYITRD